MDGIINVLKPPGMSSHDVVDFVRRTLGIKKAGHAGTLDPGAAGVLVVCLGAATRLARFLLDDDKEYRAEVSFGLATSSGDSFGEATGGADASSLTEARVRSVLPFFTGEISQVPPMTSALKIKGKKLYQLARAGQEVDRPVRFVKIYSLKYISGSGWGESRPTALLHLHCSKGTYVRTLCTDLGSHLKCGAFMSFLVRTRSGSFKIEDSWTLEELKDRAAKGKIENCIISLDEVLSDLPQIMVRDGAVKAVLSGSKLYLPGVASFPEKLHEGELVRLSGPSGTLALAVVDHDPLSQERIIFKPVCQLAKTDNF